MTTIATVAAAGLCAAAMLTATAEDRFEVPPPQEAACGAPVRLVGQACPDLAPACGTVERIALAGAVPAGAPRNVCLIFFDETDRPQG